MRRADFVLLFAISTIALTVPRLGAEPQAARGRGVSGPPVAPEKLEALLPKLPGWERGEPSSEVMAIGPGMSVARVQFDKGDLSMTLEITDTLANPMLMGPWAMLAGTATPAGRTVEGVTAKTFPIGGFTGIEVWDSKEKAADAIVVVNGRFVVKASLSDAKDTSAPRAAVEAVNFKALAVLK
jgi:hypothetical protein